LATQEVGANNRARRRGWQRLLSAIGLVLLLAQVVSVVHAHASGGRRYFAWAPNDYAVAYTIDVSVAGHALSADEIQRRYRLPAQGLFEDPPERLLDFIDRYEDTEGRHDGASVTVHYSLDGHRPRVWRRG